MIHLRECRVGCITIDTDYYFTRSPEMRPTISLRIETNCFTVLAYLDRADLKWLVAALTDGGEKLAALY